MLDDIQVAMQALKEKYDSLSIIFDDKNLQLGDTAGLKKYLYQQGKDISQRLSDWADQVIK